MNKPFHINIAGAKNSGKTGLIVDLIKEFRRRDFRIGTVKHTSHDHEFDTEGTDSWKHRQSGSASTVILSPGKFVCHSDMPDEANLARRMQMIFDGFDIVLWEGDADSRNMKIVVIREGEKSIYSGGNLIAVISDGEVDTEARHFKPGEAPQICEWLIDFLNLNEKG